MDKKQKILSFIRMRGPSLPVHVSKQIDTSILMASAIISEMVSRGELKVSNLKYGGSPLYYIKGQESQLEKFKDKLNPKDRQTLQMLKEKKVVRDVALQPIERVSLRRIKDFAKPLNVRVGENKEIFWKWYTISNDVAQQHLQSMFKTPEQQIKKPIAKKEPIEKEQRPEELFQPVQTKPKPEPQKEEIKPEKIVPIKKEAKETIEQEVEKPKKELKPEDDTIKDSFFGQISKFLSKKNIEIIKSEIIRKGSEIDLIINVPSKLGDLKYYCKAKSKKTSNDTDLAAALIQGQNKKLPVIYLTKGKLTKKVQEQLNKDFNAIKIIFMNNGD